MTPPLPQQVGARGCRAAGAAGASRHWAPTAVLCHRWRCGAGAGGRGTPDAPVCGAATATRWADGEWWLPWGPTAPQAGAASGTVERGAWAWSWATGVPTLLPPPVSLQFRLRNHDTPLTLTRWGLVLAPAGGFDPSNDTQVGTSVLRLSQPHLGMPGLSPSLVLPAGLRVLLFPSGSIPFCTLSFVPILIPVPIPVPIPVSSSSSSPSPPLFPSLFLLQPPFSSLSPFPFLSLPLFLSPSCPYSCPCIYYYPHPYPCLCPHPCP